MDKTYKILGRFDATDDKDAEDFVFDMHTKGWLVQLDVGELCMTKHVF